MENLLYWIGLAAVAVNALTGVLDAGRKQMDLAVSSDLILLMGYGRKPGAENGRPLIPVGPNFWRIEKGYPLSRN